MQKSKPFSVFFSVILLLTLPLFSSAQLFYAHQGAKLVALSEENAAVQLGSVESFLSLQKAYQNLKNNAKIVVPDSVVIYFTTDDAGKISYVKTLHAISAVHVEAMEKAISKQTLTAASSHLMVWVFPKPDVEAYPIWDVETPPVLKSCRKINKEPNALFSISCFNYVARSRLLEIPKPSPKKEEELQGYFRATVTISAKGDVQMVQFDSLSTNPNVNDYFVNQLYTVIFPKGGTKNGIPVGYFIVFEDEYFPSEKKLEFQIEEPVAYDNVYKLYNDFKNKQTILEDTVKQSVVLAPWLQAQIVLSSNLNDVTLTNRKNIAGPVLAFRISAHRMGYFNGTECFVPVYSPKRKTVSQFATLASCDTSSSNLSICTAQWLLNYLHNSFKSYNPSDYSSTITIHSVLINEDGNIERIVVTGGEKYAQLDLEMMSLLSELPKFTPGTIDGIKQPTLYNILVTVP